MQPERIEYKPPVLCHVTALIGSLGFRSPSSLDLWSSTLRPEKSRCLRNRLSARCRVPPPQKMVQTVENCPYKREVRHARNCASPSPKYCGHASFFWGGGEVLRCSKEKQKNHRYKWVLPQNDQSGALSGASSGDQPPKICSGVGLRFKKTQENNLYGRLNSSEWH